MPISQLKTSPSESNIDITEIYRRIDVAEWWELTKIRDSINIELSENPNNRNSQELNNLLGIVQEKINNTDNVEAQNIMREWKELQEIIMKEQRLYWLLKNYFNGRPSVYSLIANTHNDDNVGIPEHKITQLERGDVQPEDITWGVWLHIWEERFILDHNDIDTESWWRLTIVNKITWDVVRFKFPMKTVISMEVAWEDIWYYANEWDILKDSVWENYMWNSNEWMKSYIWESKWVDEMISNLEHYKWILESYFGN